MHVYLSTCCSIFSASLMGSILYTICLNTVGFMAPDTRFYTMMIFPAQ